MQARSVIETWDDIFACCVELSSGLLLLVSVCRTWISPVLCAFPWCSNLYSIVMLQIKYYAQIVWSYRCIAVFLVKYFASLIIFNSSWLNFGNFQLFLVWSIVQAIRKFLCSFSIFAKFYRSWNWKYTCNVTIRSLSQYPLFKLAPGLIKLFKVLLWPFVSVRETKKLTLSCQLALWPFFSFTSSPLAVGKTPICHRQCHPSQRHLMMQIAQNIGPLIMTAQIYSLPLKSGPTVSFTKLCHFWVGNMLLQIIGRTALQEHTTLKRSIPYLPGSQRLVARIGLLLCCVQRENWTKQSTLRNWDGFMEGFQVDTESTIFLSSMITQLFRMLSALL